MTRALTRTAALPVRLPALVAFATALLILAPGAAAADAPPRPTARQLGQRITHYEPMRSRLRLQKELALIGPQGPTTLAAGTTLTQTRRLTTAHDGIYAYVVTDDAEIYGLAPEPELSAAAAPLTSHEADAAATARFPGFLGRILAGIVHGKGTQRYEDNAGAKKLADAPQAVALTTDLCPTHRRFEEGLYRELVALGRTLGHPVPVTAFVSGRWLDSSQPQRAKELELLREWSESGALSITFANHSYRHPYHPGRPFAQDFMLASDVDFAREILDTERAMLRAGLVPAPYFRFPGLISTPALQRRLHDELSVADVGAGAWPGRGQPIELGDVVLVHGNGGEPGGVRALHQWLSRHDADLKAGRLQLVSAPAMLAP